MIKTNYLYLIVGLALTLFCTPACYTLLQHPRLAEIDYQRPNSDKCSTCHTAEEIWGFHHLPKASETEVPWWYDRYWDYDNRSDLETVPVSDRSVDIPADIVAPAAGETSAGSTANTPLKEKPPANAKQETKENGDGNAQDLKKKSRRPLRSKSEKKKKGEKKKP